MSDNRYSDDPGRRYRSGTDQGTSSQRTGGNYRSRSPYTGASYDRRYTRNSSSNIDRDSMQGGDGYSSGSYAGGNSYNRGSSYSGSYSGSSSYNRSGSTYSGSGSYNRSGSTYSGSSAYNRSTSYSSNRPYTSGTSSYTGSSYSGNSTYRGASSYNRSGSSYSGSGSYTRNNSTYSGSGSTYRTPAGTGSYNSGTGSSYRRGESDRYNTRYGNDSRYARGNAAGSRDTGRPGTSRGNGSGNPPRGGKRKRKMRPTAILMWIVMLLVAVLAIWGVSKLFGKLGAKIGSKDVEQGTESLMETPSEIETEPPRTITPFKMVFVGDVMLQDALDNYIDRGVEGLISPGVKDVLATADFLMLNEEFPFGTGETPVEGKAYTYQVDPKYVLAFKEMGVDLVSLANNHALDYGGDVLKQTFAALGAEGIKYVGAGNTMDEAAGWKTFSMGGANVAFLSGSRVLPTMEWSVEKSQPGIFSCYDTTLMVQQIKAAKLQNDLVVVYLHWGDLNANAPVDYQKQMAREFAEAGADLIIGSHAHAFQGIEYINGVPVIYNMGNFIYGRSMEHGAMLQVQVNSDLSLGLKMVPIASANYRTYVKDDEDAVDGLKYMESLSTGVTIDNEGNVTGPGMVSQPAAAETSPALETGGEAAESSPQAGEAEGEEAPELAEGEGPVG